MSVSLENALLRYLRMTLETAKDLLNANNIPFEICYYRDEAVFFVIYVCFRL